MSKRTLYWVLGGVFFVLGVLGYILPVLPGTFPMICAAYFFGKADPRIERWMLEHSVIGPPLRRWRETGGMTMRAKIMAISMIAVSAGLSILLTSISPWGKLAIALAAGGAALYLATRPTVSA